MIAENLTNSGGHSVLYGLPVRQDLVVEAREPGSELFASIRVNLEPGRRETIDPLPIPQPATLTVRPRLQEAFRARYRDAKILGVSLRADDIPGSPERPQRLGDREQITFEKVRPGRWTVSALVQAGGNQQPIQSEHVNLKSGETRTIEPIVSPIVASGTVTAHGRGVQALIGLREAEVRGNATRRVVPSDSSGHFEIVLAAAGLYDVQVRRVEAPEVLLELGEVSFEPPNPVELQLPSGSVTVVVRDRKEAVADVRLTARLRRSAGTGIAEVVRVTKTTRAGEARLDDLMDGQWLVQARHDGTGRVAEAIVTLESKAPEQRVELQLDDATRIEGRVYDAAGVPVVDAQVDCLFLGTNTVPEWVGAHSDGSGELRADLPSRPAALLRCSVVTAFGAVGMYTTPITSFATFSLPAGTGALLIRDWAAKVNHGTFWVVGDGGRAISLSHVAGKIHEKGSQLDNAGGSGGGCSGGPLGCPAQCAVCG